MLVGIAWQQLDLTNCSKFFFRKLHIVNLIFLQKLLWFFLCFGFSFLFSTSIYLQLYLCPTHTHINTNKCIEARGRLSRIGSLLSLCGFLGLNSGCRLDGSTLTHWAILLAYILSLRWKYFLFMHLMQEENWQSRSEVDFHLYNSKLAFLLSIIKDNSGWPRKEGATASL